MRSHPGTLGSLVSLAAVALLCFCGNAGAADADGDTGRTDSVTKATPPVKLTAAGCLSLEVPEAGLVRDGGIALYVPDNLFEAINGEAEQFLDYGFRQLAVASYKTDAGRMTFELSVYDMDRPLDAFGIYSRRRFADAKFLQLGAQGFWYAPELAAFKGRFFLRIQCEGPAEAVMDAAVKLARATLKRVPGPAQAPAILAVLPRRGLVPNSEVYMARGALGAAFMGPSLEAKYRLGPGEKEATLVLSGAGDIVKATSTHAKLVEFFAAKAEPLASDSIENADQSHLLATKYYGEVIVWRFGRYLAVLADLDDAEGAVSFAARLVVHVRRTIAEMRAATATVQDKPG